MYSIPTCGIWTRYFAWLMVIMLLNHRTRPYDTPDASPRLVAQRQRLGIAPGCATLRTLRPRRRRKQLRRHRIVAPVAAASATSATEVCSLQLRKCLRSSKTCRKAMHMQPACLIVWSVFLTTRLQCFNMVRLPAQTSTGTRGTRCCRAGRHCGRPLQGPSGAHLLPVI